MSDLDFDLPIIKGDVMPAPVLSMDQYLEFVEFFYKNVLDQDAYREWQKTSVVNERFSLSD